MDEDKLDIQRVEKEYKVEVGIAEGGLIARLRIVPLDTEVAAVAEADLYEALAGEGVTFGILNDAVQKMAEEKPVDTWVTVAQGEKAGNGCDGYVHFHFSREGRKVRLKEDASGRVNFKDMNLIQNVKKGDVLCELIPPEKGRSGRTVRGEEIPGRLGIPAKLPSGKNVEVADNGAKLVAAIDGMVVWEDPRVSVEPVYVVDMVDSNTGNIRFNGSVVVNGEIGDGFEIHAAEDVTVG
ncbi:MAG TPA: FapA family protein, partial [Deltaproteobacteria bacterium]|nr:FapA family protein [Deltaproteobacteria bacterium]